VQTAAGDAGFRLSQVALVLNTIKKSLSSTLLITKIPYTPNPPLHLKQYLYIQND